MKISLGAVLANLETQRFFKKIENAGTVPGTRSYHYFQPVSTDSIGTKSTSSDAT